MYTILEIYETDKLLRGDSEITYFREYFRLSGHFSEYVVVLTADIVLYSYVKRCKNVSKSLTKQ